MKKLLFGFSLIFIGFSVQAQDALISTEVKDHIKARVDNHINVGIVVGVVDGDKVEYFSYGKTALENGSDVDENSVFEIGSISKTFTTIMVADEVLKGNMKLSDPIQKFFPEGVTVPTRNNRVITVKDIATHSSGLPRMPDNFEPSNPNNPYADYTIPMAYEFMSHVELTRDIGSLYEYSNFGMGMLGHILELINDKSFEDLLVERIANVYDMKDTRVVFTDNMKAHLAKGHAKGVEVENWDLPALAGAGAIRSTASDMVKYLNANMGMTPSPMYDAMKMTHEVAYKNEAQDFSMGMAWHYGLDDTVVWHNGGTGGYISFAGFLKGTNKGVVVLTNTQENINAIGFKLLGDTAVLEMPKKSIAVKIENEIEANGIESGIALYRKSKAAADDSFNFDEGELNSLGYSYLNKDKNDIALAIFKLNVEMFPNASNPYDSLGEAYLKVGDSTLAKKNYGKSVELNPANVIAIEVLESLGVTAAVKNVDVAPEVLDTYAGKYELAPNFIVTITRKENELFAQATGQPQFPIFASEVNKFYFKVVEASVVFNADEAGEITSMTLYQGGQVVPGKKIE
ncbi:serine hydrolase [Lacinutrix himadriensis]|uniref:serine hydrolase n=1 Tax=Lacinutrix himadriensis TaxID=641549 RepID=UPI0006E3548F|nr:serine hydrolase [Lacinutrix himadriensis]